MKKFTHPMMDVAFTAERGVQDELERESAGDVLTILISYCVMFAYIALGKLTHIDAHRRTHTHIDAHRRTHTVTHINAHFDTHTDTLMHTHRHIDGTVYNGIPGHPSSSPVRQLGLEWKFILGNKGVFHNVVLIQTMKTGLPDVKVGEGEVRDEGKGKEGMTWF